MFLEGPAEEGVREEEGLGEGAEWVEGEVEEDERVGEHGEERLGEVEDAVVGEVEALEGGRLLEKIFRHGSYTVVC